MRRLSAAAATAALLLALALPASGGAATGPYDPGAEAGAPSAAPPRLTEAAVIRTVLETPKVADWLERYPPAPQTDAAFDRLRRTWTVHVWSGEAGEIARGVVTDPGGAVVEAWTGVAVTCR